MPDTERYRQWLAMQQGSDRVLVQLVLIAASAVFVWDYLRTLREPWRARLRTGYMAVALAFLLTQLVRDWTGATVFVGICAALIAGRALWLKWHTTKGAMQ